MEEGTVTTQSRTRSFIIKRPRLTKLLDESEARILLLVAPAGYGKTTLAREWLEGKDAVAWYSAGPSMADVAALAVGIAEALDPDEAERIRILAANGQQGEALARAIARAEATQECAILAIDDCHHAGDSPEATSFLSELLAKTSFTIVATSRVRPPWVTPRMMVYGDATVIDMDELAFTNEEARVVLGGSEEHRAAILAESRGWPAVIGLAAMRDDRDIRDDARPDDLYEFFANELFQNASPALQSGLLLLALGAGASVELSRELLGAHADALLTEGSECGFLALAPDGISMHPLLRGFLVAKLRQAPNDESKALVTQVAEGLAGRSLWDECLATLEEFPLSDLLASMLGCALIELLDAGRTATVKRWLELAEENSVTHPLMLLAEAEIALRERDDSRAQALGERAGELLEADLAARGFLVAARAAHLSDDHAGTIRNAKLAEATATTRRTRTAALWTQLISDMDWLDGDLPETLNRLSELDDKSPEFALRLALARSSLLVNVDLDAKSALRELQSSTALLAHARDPLLKTSVLNFLAHLSAIGARYEQALDMTRQEVEEARGAGLEFPIDYALLARAVALVGLRKIRLARQVLDELHRRAPAASPHVLQNTRLISVRMCIASGDMRRARALLEFDAEDSTDRATVAEIFAYRALVLAVFGQLEEANEALQHARDGGRFAAYVMAQLATAVAGLQCTSADGDSEAIAILKRVIHVGGIDAVVTACRACPDLARAGLGDPEIACKLVDVFARSRDVDLARRVGIDVPRERRHSDGLSTREEEVYALLVQGMTNRDIARSLYISESTAKVHVRHIFEKLGVHSRAEAAHRRVGTTP